MKEPPQFSKPSKIFTKENVHPLVLKFQNGTLQDSGDDPVGGIFTHSNGTGKQAVAVINKMVYSGPQEVNNLCRNTIIARDRTTGEVRWIEVGSALLQAVTENDELGKKRPAELDVPDVAAFGSKRKKRAVEQYKKLKVDIDTMKDQLEKTVVSNEIDELDMSQHVKTADSHMDSYAPPINREATDVANVCKVRMFLNKEQLQSLKEAAVDIFENENCEIEASDYITPIILKLKETDDPKKIVKCCLLLYADCIIRYLKENYRSVTSIQYIVCPYSELLNNLIFDSFSMSNEKGRTRPTACKDKAVCYLICSLLLAGEYLIPDMKKLAAAINYTLPKLGQLVKVVGAHVVAEGKVSAIVLKLPLSKPPAVSMRKSRK